MRKNEFTKIKLKTEWMGNPKGHTMTIKKATADILISRGAAKLLKDKEEKTEKMQAPAKHRMLARAVKSK